MDSPSRSAERYSLYEDLRICYEGFAGNIPVHVPDLSTHGMFINTTLSFPEGAILRVSFVLPRTHAQISARAEVRYCLAGTGVGLEFINLEEEKARLIELELAGNTCPPESCLPDTCCNGNEQPGDA